MREEHWNALVLQSFVIDAIIVLILTITVHIQYAWVFVGVCILVLLIYSNGNFFMGLLFFPGHCILYLLSLFKGELITSPSLRTAGV